MRESDLRARLSKQLGSPYALAWADTVALAGVGHRTVTQALQDGVPCAAIWRAVCDILVIPEAQR